MADSPQDSSTAKPPATAHATQSPPPPNDIFTPPSIHLETLLSGASHTYFSPVPPRLLPPPSPSSTSSPSTSTTEPAAGEECVLGIDEAGRGPVLGPMVYSVFYLPTTLSDPLLRTAHSFDDSKVLTPSVRASLMRAICDPSTDLHSSCGWATASLSARDISSAMLRPAAPHNLNAQALDATVELVRGVLARGVNVREVYVDTIGPPASYQARLQRFFPGLSITVAKKADSIYPCVSAASVCAKVTRDLALEALYRHRPSLLPTVHSINNNNDDDDEKEQPPQAQPDADSTSWGSGYPSDARCTTWLRANMHAVFGWGPECRFSWGTAKDMLDGRSGVRVEWPVEGDGGEADSGSRVTDFFTADGGGSSGEGRGEMGAWFGSPAGLEAF